MLRCLQGIGQQDLNTLPFYDKVVKSYQSGQLPNQKIIHAYQLSQLLAENGSSLPVELTCLDFALSVNQLPPTKRVARECLLSDRWYKT